MADPIEAHYTPDGDDWAVAVTGRGRTLTGRAPGLIAARDRADQLVEELAPEEKETGHRTVVHMLNGDAVEFTNAYLTARLTRTEEPAAEAPVEPDPEVPAPAKADEPTRAKPTPFPRKESDATKPAVQPPAAQESATSGS